MLNYPTPEHLFREINSRQYSEILAMYDTELWGVDALYYAASIIASQVALPTWPKKAGKLTATTFIPKWKLPWEQEDEGLAPVPNLPEKIDAVFRAMAASFAAQKAKQKPRPKPVIQKKVPHRDHR